MLISEGFIAGKLYLIGGIATPGESRAQAGEELITVDTTNWVCTRKFTTGAGPEFTDSHAAVIAGVWSVCLLCQLCYFQACCLVQVLI